MYQNLSFIPFDIYANLKHRFVVFFYISSIDFFHGSRVVDHVDVRAFILFLFVEVKTRPPYCTEHFTEFFTGIVMI